MRVPTLRVPVSMNADIPDEAIRRIIVGENQKLLLKIEELIMSAVKPVIDLLIAKADALIAKNAELAASNVTLTADAALKDEQLAAKDQQMTVIQGELTVALANAVDPAEVALLEGVVQKLTDAIG